MNNGFKRDAEEFAYAAAKGFQFINLKKHSPHEVWNCWIDLTVQNVKKANFLCSKEKAMPNNKETIGQGQIFDAQLRDFVVAHDEVAVLNSFPLFLFDYCREEVLIPKED